MDCWIVDYCTSGSSRFNERFHWRLIPGHVAQFAPLQEGADVVVPVFEDIGFDRQVVADHSFEGVASAINQGDKVFDNDGGLFRDHRVEQFRAGAVGLWVPAIE